MPAFEKGIGNCLNEIYAKTNNIILKNIRQLKLAPVETTIKKIDGYVHRNL